MCLVKKGWREEPWVWLFVLIYSVLLVKTFLSLGLSFLFSVKAVTALALPARTVPEKEKGIRTTCPILYRTLGMRHPRLSMAARRSQWSERVVEFVLQDPLSCPKAVVRVTPYVCEALRTEPDIDCQVSESCSGCDRIHIFITVSVGCGWCGEGISSWGGKG